MVSLQSPVRLSPNHRIVEPENPATPQKRKTFELPNNHDCTERQALEKRHKSEFQNFMDDIELHLESPLPSEWQRCLDIQSGKIHFYNTKTHARTSKDPRKMISPHHHHHHHHHHDHHMSLDLELNLTTTSEPSSFVRKEHMSRAATNNNYYSSPSTASTTTTTTTSTSFCNFDSKQKAAKSGGSSTPPWLALEADRHEMVATVCVRCHMLVMLCRSSPACPNCKFVHPPEKTPSSFALERSKY